MIPYWKYDGAELHQGHVLDPFAGSGTTLEVAIRLGRRCVGIELSQPYCDEHIIPRLETPIQPVLFQA